MILHRQASCPAVAWKNGGGLTRELHRQPADGAEFDWRLSLATIERPGPFSVYAGYERALVLVSGTGLVLNFKAHGHAVLDSPGETACFDGAWETSCALPGGPSRDLNLMVARERAEYIQRSFALTDAELVTTAGWEETLVCCISGALQVMSASAETVDLDAVDVARCTVRDGIVTCRPRDARAATVFIAKVRRLARRDDLTAPARALSDRPA